MNTRVEQDRDGMFRVFVDGDLLEGAPGRPLRYETAQAAEDMLARRAELFSLPVRPLREYL